MNTTASFKQLVDLVLAHEGDLSLNPVDPGNWTGGARDKGELRGTRFGISAGAYPDVDIVNLTREDAKAIYYRDYWQAVDADHLPAGVNYAVFDAAVNAGVRRATRWLQTSLRVSADGIIGPQTLAAIKASTPTKLLRDFQAHRLYHYMRLVNLTKTYGYGWARRTLDVYAKALQLMLSQGRSV